MNYPNLTEEVSVYKINASNTYPITPSAMRILSAGIGTTGSLNITAIDGSYNNFWVKTNCAINESIGEGYNKIKLACTNSGETNSYKVYYTVNNFNPIINSYLLTLNTAVYSYLSGVSYYSTSSTFYISYGISNLFNPVYALADQTVLTSNSVVKVLKL